MAHGAMIAVHAAHAAAQAQARVLDAFRVRNATAPERALPLAELGLSRDQFRQFKKKVFEAYHDGLKPKTSELLKDVHERKAAMK
jgi:hypothetical protein